MFVSFCTSVLSSPVNRSWVCISSPPAPPFAALEKLSTVFGGKISMILSPFASTNGSRSFPQPYALEKATVLSGASHEPMSNPRSILAVRFEAFTLRASGSSGQSVLQTESALLRGSCVERTAREM